MCGILADRFLQNITTVYKNNHYKDTKILLAPPDPLIYPFQQILQINFSIHLYALYSMKTIREILEPFQEKSKNYF